MRLAVPRSAADNVAITGIIDPQNWWIGVDDRVTEGAMRASDGTALAFTNFATGQPDNASGAEDCVHLLATSFGGNTNVNGRTWNDAPCGLARVGSTPIGGLLCEEPCRSAVVDGRTIDFCSEQASYARAEGLCAQRGGALVAIPSSGANASLLAAATTTMPGLPYWIGLTDRATEGTFRWSDGGAQGTAPYLFNGFVAGEPNNGGGSNEDCARAAAGTGGWSDVACSTTSAFACDVDAAPPTFTCGNGVVEAFETCDDGNTVNTDSCNNQCTPNLTQTAFADFNNGTVSPFDLSFGCAGFGCPSVVGGALRLNGDWNVLRAPAAARVGNRFAMEFTVVDPQALRDFGFGEGPRIVNGRLCNANNVECQTTRLPQAGDVWRIEADLQAKTARVLLNGVQVIALTNMNVPASYRDGVIFTSGPVVQRVNGTVDNLRWFSGP
jgi:cysteine-rich repeat protein